MKKLISSLAVMMAVCICMVMVGVGIPVSALSYSGSGTIADPYLVTNAEQLQGMRENLSAHYKLANTIDLSGVDFKPVGRFDNPFTGSFMCELNSDNTPKYVIKNLKIHVAESEYAGDKVSKWEAGLFGVTDGATLSGIYVMDAYVRNENFGDNEGGVAYGTYKPGLAYQNTGVLAGHAANSNITNCATTGIVDTRASHVGGFIGEIEGGNIENCYTTVDVTTEGYWCTGGFTGNIYGGSTVTSCFATGNVTGSSVLETQIGAFHGCNSATFKDCYSLGKITNNYEGDPCVAESGVTYNPGGSVPNISAIGYITDASKYSPQSGSSNNGATSSDNNTNTDKVTSTDKNTNTDKVTSTDKNTNTDKVTSTDKNTNTDKVTSTDKNTNTDKVTSSNNNTDKVTSSNNNTDNIASSDNNTTETNSNSNTIINGGTDTNTDVVSSEVVEASSADEVAKLAEALPEDAETLTLENKQAVMDAWFAYDSMSFGDKDDFNANLFARISNARYKMSMLMAGEVIDGVHALPEVEELSSSDVENVLSLYKDYEFMHEDVSSLLDVAVVDKLNAAYEWAQTAEADASDAAATVSGKLQPIEWVIVIFCGVIILVSCSFAIAASIFMMKSKKKEQI